MDGRVSSLDGNRYERELANGRFFTELYLRARRKNAGLTLKEFNSEFWGPDQLTIAESNEQNASSTECAKNYQNSGIHD
jgi:hypothetical protein